MNQKDLDKVDILVEKLTLYLHGDEIPSDDLIADIKDANFVFAAMSNLEYGYVYYMVKRESTKLLGFYRDRSYKLYKRALCKMAESMADIYIQSLI
jgi:hypothetical protein